jgi:hypothetical protein
VVCIGSFIRHKLKNNTDKPNSLPLTNLILKPPDFISVQKVKPPDFISVQKVKPPDFIKVQKVKPPDFIGVQKVKPPDFIGVQKVKPPDFIGVQKVKPSDLAHENLYEKCDVDRQIYEQNTAAQCYQPTINLFHTVAANNKPHNNIMVANENFIFKKTDKVTDKPQDYTDDITSAFKLYNKFQLPYLEKKEIAEANENTQLIQTNTQVVNEKLPLLSRIFY